MLSCFHQNFWRLKRGEFLQFAKCVNFRRFLWSLRNQNLRQWLNNGNISFVIKPTQTHWTVLIELVNLLLCFLAEGFTQVLRTGFFIINLLNFPNKIFLIFNCCFWSLWGFFHNHCIRFQEYDGALKMKCTGHGFWRCCPEVGMFWA